MNKEMREQINKIKNWKQFLSESFYISNKESEENYDNDAEGVAIIKNNKEVGKINFYLEKENTEIYIFYIETLEKGIGRETIKYLFDKYPTVNKIYGEAAGGSEKFWIKVGAIIGDYDKNMEGYEFEIHR